MPQAEYHPNVILNKVPSQTNDTDILSYLQSNEVNWKHINAIKDLTNVNDDVISDWLNISVRTFREYRKRESVFKENVKEHVVLLITILKHGIKVFGSSEAFDSWLIVSNFYFGNRTPQSFLNTITGIKFVDDRLTAMEHGDNV